MGKGKRLKSKVMKYYEVEPSLNSSFYSSWELTNWDRLQFDTKGLGPKSSWPDGIHSTTRGPWTVPEYIEAPHFVISKRKKNALSDFGIIDGFMFISSKLKAILDELAPDTCDYRICTTEFSDGTPGPETWLCSVTKVFREAIDIENSQVIVTWQGSYSFLEFQFTGGGYLIFLRDVIGSAVLFRLAEFNWSFICNESFKQACRSAKIRGVSFKPIGELAE